MWDRALVGVWLAVPSGWGLVREWEIPLECALEGGTACLLSAVVKLAGRLGAESECAWALQLGLGWGQVLWETA